MRLRFTIGTAIVLAAAGFIAIHHQHSAAQEQPDAVENRLPEARDQNTPGPRDANSPRGAAGGPSAGGAPPGYPAGFGGNPNGFPYPGMVPGGVVLEPWMKDGVMAYRAYGAVTADPETQKLASEDQKLEAGVRSLVRQLTDSGEDARAELTKKLQSMLEKQFETQQKLREREISQIEARVQKLRDLVRKRTDSRRKIIDNRYEQLLNDAEGLGWSSSSASPGGFQGMGRGNQTPPAVTFSPQLPGLPASPTRQSTITEQ